MEKNRFTINIEFKNGKGSYNDIIRNLLIFKNKYPEYYENYVSYGVVFVLPQEFEERWNSIVNNNQISCKKIKILNIEIKNSSLKDDFYFEYTDKYKQKLYDLENKYHYYLLNPHLKNGNNEFILLQQLFEQDLIVFHKRSMSIMPEVIGPRGICIPKTRKLFVNPQGKFAMCEKVGHSFPIGSVQSGFDFNNIFKIIDKFCKFRESDCIKCWAYRVCSACFLFCKSGNTWDKKMMNTICNNRKNIILKNLRNYCSLREKKQIYLTM